MANGNGTKSRRQFLRRAGKVAFAAGYVAWLGTTGAAGIFAGLEIPAVVERTVYNAIAPAEQDVVISLMLPQDPADNTTSAINTVNFGGKATVIQIDPKSDGPTARKEIKEALYNYIAAHGSITHLVIASHGMEDTLIIGAPDSPNTIAVTDLLQDLADVQEHCWVANPYKHNEPDPYFMLVQKNIFFAGCSIFAPSNTAITEKYYPYASTLGNITASKAIVYTTSNKIALVAPETLDTGDFWTIDARGNVRPYTYNTGLLQNIGFVLPSVVGGVAGGAAGIVSGAALGEMALRRRFDLHEALHDFQEAVKPIVNVIDTPVKRRGILKGMVAIVAGSLLSKGLAGDHPSPPVPPYPSNPNSRNIVFSLRDASSISKDYNDNVLPDEQMVKGDALVVPILVDKDHPEKTIQAIRETIQKHLSELRSIVPGMTLDKVIISTNGDTNLLGQRLRLGHNNPKIIDPVPLLDALSDIQPQPFCHSGLTLLVPDLFANLPIPYADMLLDKVNKLKFPVSGTYTEVYETDEGVAGLAATFNPPEDPHSREMITRTFINPAIYFVYNPPGRIGSENPGANSKWIEEVNQKTNMQQGNQQSPAPVFPKRTSLIQR